MALDGEWRTAFIKNGTPDLNYGTAPSPVPDSKEDLYGIGRVGGTIIGIPAGSAHEAEAWLLVKFMATNTGSLVAAANAIGNVPTTYESLESPRLSLPEQFDTFLDVFSNPNSHYKDMSVLGSADQDLLASFAAKWQSGKITISKRVCRTWRNRSTISWSKPAADRGGGAIAGTLTAAARRPVSKRRPARRRAALRHGLPVHAAWIIGFSVFIAYPMIGELLLLLHELRPSGGSDVRRSAELPIHVHQGPDVLAGDAEHAVDHRGGRPLQIVTSLSLAWLLTRPKRGSRYLPDDAVPAHDGPSRGGRAGVRVPVQPRDRPDQPGSAAVGVDDPPLWFYSAFWSKWGLVFLSLWGVGQTMMVFLAGLLDVPRQLYEAAEIEGAGAWQRFRYVTLPMISPVIFFSVVIGSHRRLPVLHAGLRRELRGVRSARRVAPRRTSADPRNRRCSTRCTCTSKAFAHFQMGYASAMAWILFLIVMACTIVIIRTSPTVGPLPGRIPIAATTTSTPALPDRHRAEPAAGPAERPTTTVPDRSGRTTRP